MGIYTNYIRPILLLVIALQVLNSSILTQNEAVCQSENNDNLIVKQDDQTAKKSVDFSTKKKVQHHHRHHSKGQKNQRHHSFKQSSVKFISSSYFEFNSINGAITKATTNYLLALPTFSKDIIPPPPKV